MALENLSFLRNTSKGLGMGLGHHSVNAATARGCRNEKKKTQSVQYALRWRLVGNRWRLVGNRWRLVGN